MIEQTKVGNFVEKKEDECFKKNVIKIKTEFSACRVLYRI